MNFDFNAFVSYAHNDADFARQVVTWLRKSGLGVWFAEEQLIPGSRFRIGLQQGVRESHHLIAVLTRSYIERPWTQRELDLFDLSADQSDRRILALQLDELDLGALDQTFQVHQRIKWDGRAFNAEAYWHLYCGLSNPSCYRWLCFPSWEAASYFSASSYATVGYVDVVLPKTWRMLGPLESIIGVLMCGLSVSVLFAIATRLAGRER
jgi:hypothetical protein